MSGAGSSLPLILAVIFLCRFERFICPIESIFAPVKTLAGSTELVLEGMRCDLALRKHVIAIIGDVVIGIEIKIARFHHFLSFCYGFVLLFCALKNLLLTRSNDEEGRRGKGAKRDRTYRMPQALKDCRDRFSVSAEAMT